MITVLCRWVNFCFHCTRNSVCYFHGCHWTEEQCMGPGKLKCHKSHFKKKRFSYVSWISTPQIVASHWFISIFLKKLILKVLPVLWRGGIQEFLTLSFFVHFVSLNALGMLIRRTTHTYTHTPHPCTHTCTHIHIQIQLGVSSKVHKQIRRVTFPISSLSVICLVFPVPWNSLFPTSNQKSGALINPLCPALPQLPGPSGRRIEREHKAMAPPSWFLMQ